MQPLADDGLCEHVLVEIADQAELSFHGAGAEIKFACSAVKLALVLEEL